MQTIGIEGIPVEKHTVTIDGVVYEPLRAKYGRYFGKEDCIFCALCGRSSPFGDHRDVAVNSYWGTRSLRVCGDCQFV